MTPLFAALIPVSPIMPGYLTGPKGQAYQEKHIHLLLTKDPFRSVYCIHRMTLLSASVCLPGLSRRSPIVRICPFSRLHSYVGRCHTLPSAPDCHTNLYFYPGMYHPGASPTDYNMSKNENKAYLCGCMVKHSV